MQRYLWNEKTSVIVTSATLTAAGEFDYLKGRLNAEEADELALGSPFDFETAAFFTWSTISPNRMTARPPACTRERPDPPVPRHRGENPGFIYFLRPAQAHFTGHLTGAVKR